MKLFDWLKPTNNNLLAEKDGKIAELKSLYEARNKTVNVLQNELIQLKREKESALKVAEGNYKKLELEYKFLSSQLKDSLAEQLNGNYPKTEIKYSGRSLPFSKEIVDCPVVTLITPNDPDIISDLKRWGLYQTGEDYETLIPKIYMKIYQEYYKYDYDKNVWGSNEVWEFPFESRYKFRTGLDCDSWAIVMVSYYRAAGVSAHLIRAVAGICELGGHATVYVYSKRMENWRHLNSTYGGGLFDKISDYPSHQDARDGKDKLGIKTIWLSFNDIYSWSTFNTAGEIKELKRFRFK